MGETATWLLSNTDIIFDTMFGFDLLQVVNKVTHEHGYSGSILDLVFVSLSITEYTLSAEKGISDHKLVHFRCSLPIQSTNKKAEIKIFKDFSCSNDNSNITHLKDTLDNFSDSDLNIRWNKFKRACNYCVDTFVPSVRKRIKRCNTWINRTIIHLKCIIKRLKKKGERH